MGTKRDLVLLAITALAIPPGLAGCDQTPPRSQLETASCDTFSEIDTSRINLAEIDFADLARRARETRGELSLDDEPPRAAAPGTLKVTDWSGFSRQSAAYLVYRLTDGRWLVRWGEGSPYEPVRKTELILTAVDTAKLDGLLARSCLYREPVYMPRKTPFKGGAMSECMDGTDTLTEIETGERRRTSFHACHSYGYSGEIRDLLYGATHTP